MKIALYSNSPAKKDEKKKKKNYEFLSGAAAGASGFNPQVPCTCPFISLLASPSKTRLNQLKLQLQITTIHIQHRLTSQAAHFNALHVPTKSCYIRLRRYISRQNASSRTGQWGTLIRSRYRVEESLGQPCLSSTLFTRLAAQNFELLYRLLTKDRLI